MYQTRLPTPGALCACLFAILLAGCQWAAPGPAAAPPVATPPNTVTCALARDADQVKGTCSIPCMVNALAIDIDGPNPKVSCSESPRQVPATLRKTGSGDQWLGTMQGKHPEDPTRFQITGGPGGVAKLPYGWFALSSVQLQGDTLGLIISANKQLPPTQDDIKIIQRAMLLVSDVKVWNKNDDRNCPPTPQKWSVFCALMQATQEVSGGIHYRQPALQAVREVVNEVGGTRVGKHRLMDYNNHPDTTLEDIHQLLRLAQVRLEQRFR
jgi:hypothetical protein